MVYAWGGNGFGQLGDNSTTARFEPTKVNALGVLRGKTVIAINGSYNHSLALCSDGTLAAWGYNGDGQLGNGTTIRSSVPILVPTLGVLTGKTVVAIAAGSHSSLALCSDGTLVAWGAGIKAPYAVSPLGVLSGKAVIAIAAGGSHRLALCSDGTVASWGRNNQGQLGDNSTTDRSAPVAVIATGVLNGKCVVAIAAGDEHSLALCSDGTVVTWGNNNYRQLGNGGYNSSSLPVAVNTAGVLSGKEVVAIDADFDHSLALCSDGTLAAWGSNRYGQLGINGIIESSVPVDTTNSGFLNGKSAVGIVAGDGSSCALCSDGTVAAWGYNGQGQLGNNSTSDSSLPVAVTSTGALSGKTVIAIADGRFALAALPISSNANLSALSFSAGDLNPTFAIGIRDYIATVQSGVASAQVTPTADDPADTIAVNGSVVASGTASAAISLSEGSNNISIVITSQDGITTKAYAIEVTRQVPVRANFTSASMIPATAGSYSATDKMVSLSLAFAPIAGASLTAVKNTGLGFITGRFTNLAQGQVVTMAFNQVAYRFIANYYGGTGNDLVLQWANTNAYAWGSNSLGQLGDGSGSNGSLPVAVTNTGVLIGKTIVAAAVGSSHSVVLCGDGSVAGWGNNTYGQLGDGSNDNRDTPVAVNATGVLNGKTVVAIAAGFNHSLALCSDGTVAAWGMNSAGQLGRGGTTSSNLPVAVTGLTGKTVVAVFAGYNHSLARCADGSVWAWGSNAYGQLGNNSTANSNVPVNITTSGELLGRTVLSLVGGSDHSLALCSDGTLLAWGRNNYGQLGNDSTINSSVPVVVDSSDVLAGKAVVSIAAGGWHGVSTCSDGTMAAFGRNNNGQLGNGLAADSPVPVTVDASGVLFGRFPLSMGGSNAHSLALCADGTLAAWGSNNNGQLGIGNTTASSMPVAVSTSTLLAGERFCGLAVGSSASHVLAIVAQPPPQNQPFTVWQATYFPNPADQANPSISGEVATPANDGITNLMKYALGLDPWHCGSADLPTPGLNDGYLTLSYRKNKQATDVVYAVQAGDTLVPGSWMPAATIISQSDAGNHWLITVRYNVPMAGNPERFMRLKVTR